MKLLGISGFFVAALLAGLIGGCSSDGAADQSRELKPRDFAGRSAKAPATQPEENKAGGATTKPGVKLAASDGLYVPSRGDREVDQILDKMPKPVVVAAPSSTTKPSDTAYTLDAMVGQVNGQAIYANRVFEPLTDQLALLGRTEPGMMFRIRAKDLIAKRLEEMVFDLLILGEAERDLSPQEQQGLAGMLKTRREELIKYWGTGSEAVANEQLRIKKGKTVDQMLSDERQTMIVRRYLSQKLLPKINVTRKDIERYYYDHLKEFAPPAGRTLRIIKTNSQDTADKIDQSLTSGAAFIDVASNRRLNQNAPDQGGKLIEEGGGLALQPLNDALGKLKVGEHSPRVQVGGNYWWVSLEAINAGNSRSLRDAQLEIEELLRRQRFQLLSQRYRNRLLTEGSYNPLDDMAESLLKVAVSRFALPE